MNGIIEAMEKFRDWRLSNVFWELTTDFPPWLTVALSAYIAKNALKRGWEKLKEWRINIMSVTLRVTL